MKQWMRLAIAFFILSTLPVALVAYVFLTSAERTTLRELENHISSIAEMRAGDVQRWTESLALLLESIAQRPLVIDLSTNLVEQDRREAPLDPTVARRLVDVHLLPHVRAGGLFRGFFVAASGTGTILASTDPQEMGGSVKGADYFEDGRAATAVEPVSRSSDSGSTEAGGRAAMHVGTPIRNSEGDVIAVLVGDVSLDRLGELVAPPKDPHLTGDVYLVASYGAFVVSSRFVSGDADDVLPRSFGIDRALAGEAGIDYYTSYRGEPVLGAFREVPELKGALVAEISQREVLAPIVGMRTTALGILGGAIAAFAVLGFALARNMTEPLRRITAGAARIGRGEFGHRIRSRRSDELGDLARSFDQMAESLQDIAASRDDLDHEVVRRREAEMTLRETVTALRESERRFRELSELLPEVVYECNCDGRITFANRVAFERFGYGSEDLAEGVSALEMIAPEDRGRAAQNIERILRGDVIGGKEYTALARDGKTFPVIIHSVAVRRGEEVVGLRGIVVDISEQKKTREALQTADEIVSTIPTGILIYRFEEPDRLILTSGNATASSFVTLGTSVGEDLATHWPPRMVERLRPSLFEVVRGGGGFDREVVVGRPGAERAFRMRAFGIPGRRIVLAFDEITERKRAEAAVVEWKNRYEGGGQGELAPPLRLGLSDGRGHLRRRLREDSRLHRNGDVRRLGALDQLDSPGGSAGLPDGDRPAPGDTRDRAPAVPRANEGRGVHPRGG